MPIIRDDPYAVFNFQVEFPDVGIDGGEVRGGFSEVSGLNVEQETISYRNGNDRSLAVRQLPGLVRYGNIVLKRGVIGGLELWQWIEQSLQGIGIEASRLELDQRVLETAGLVNPDVAQVVAAPANAVHLFGRVYHLEVRREAADQLRRSGRVELPDERAEFFTGFFVALAAPDRAQPRVLDEFKQFLAVLLTNEVADHRAECAHVIAQ